MLRFGPVVVCVALLAAPAAIARPSGPALFCDAYPDSATCAGRGVACVGCHTSTSPEAPAWNNYGLAILSRLLPGPYCTQLLVDLGAEVIKVEDPQGGDYVRYTPPLLDDGQGALFWALNRGKKSITLDLKDPQDHARFLALCETADVVRCV